MEVRPIDANALINKLDEMISKAILADTKIHYALVRELVAEQPTIEAEPVRYGQWIEKPPYSDETVKGLEFQIVCSLCDEQNSSITFDENSVPIAKTFYRTRYCPNCGAYMRKVSEDAGTD